MVNSATFESDKQEADRNEKAGCTQPHDASSNSKPSSPVTVRVALQCKPGFPQTADTDGSGGPSCIGAQAIEPTPTRTEFNNMPIENITSTEIISSAEHESSRVSESPTCTDADKSTLCCSLPLEKVQVVLTPFQPLPQEEDVVVRVKPTRKLLCLYCDRSFVNAKLRQKHVERTHSVKQNRRVSSRRQNQFTVTPCIYCDKLNSTENTLKDLFQHLVNEHSSKYFGCLPCEDRFLNSSHLADHNASNHQSAASPSIEDQTQRTGKISPATQNLLKEEKTDIAAAPQEHVQPKLTRSRLRTRMDYARSAKLRNKKLTVKSSRLALKKRESKRLQAIAKAVDSQKKRSKQLEKRPVNVHKPEESNSTKIMEKTKSGATCINPYPEFDNFYRVKKITDHSIDNLKISSLTFDDVFDKAFFNRIKCNIEENLLHHIDGKLFKNEESESRISNFEKISSNPQEAQNSNPDHYGCELSLNAVTPVASLSLNSQYGEDFESQIEYGAKPSKKKTQTKTDEVHYKYFTRRKYQASILEHKENRDLSKLDMWTQLVIKKSQQKMLDKTKSAKEMMEYTTGTEYRSKMRREELNRILDRRGPFEDLREEASKKAAFDKLNSISEDTISHESFTDIQDILNEILQRVFGETVSCDNKIEEVLTENSTYSKPDDREIPSYLNLRPKSSLPSEGEIDKSDRISLICSSQETESFELPTNQVRGKNEIIELSGEWARCRMYICAACGAKLLNMRNLIDHKSIYHQNVWVQHYEFVGNQNELYRHLSIPVLGKVGKVEETVPCKVWKRSDARLCTKCSKQCNSLGELHRHILECGGDWTWMLVRKKCKYRPYGAKSRRKRRGLVSRIYHKQKTEPTEKKKYKKTFDGPRQRPSDADTIERMLANLPAKRSTRKLISLHDGIYRARKTNQINNQKKVKCGKVIYTTSKMKENTEKAISGSRIKVSNKPQMNNASTKRRSLRSFTKVISSRILDTSKKLTVKRKLRVINERRKTRRIQDEITNSPENNDDKESHIADKLELKNCGDSKTKCSSPHYLAETVKKLSVKKILTGKINIKSFFPVKKKKNRKSNLESTNLGASQQLRGKNTDSATRNRRRSKEKDENIETIIPDVSSNEKSKKHKNQTITKLVRSLSITQKSKIKDIVREKRQSSKSEVVEKADLPTDQIEEHIKETKTVKKRKLKQNFKNVINSVKKMKIDSTQYDETCNSKSEQGNKIDSTKTKEITFLDKSQLSDQSVAPQEKIIIPSTFEAKENLADISETALIAGNLAETKENPLIPENIFHLESKNEEQLQAKGELDFDSKPLIQYSKSVLINTTRIESTDTRLDPISVETSVKSQTIPLSSPNHKGKIRKPARGLNDCIAMLTSKLQQKKSETVKVHHVLPPVSPIKTVTDPIPHKPECILKIPTFKTNLISPLDEALDLTTKKKDLEHDLYPLRPIYFTQPPIYSTMSSIDQTINTVIENTINAVSTVKWQNVKNSVDETIQRVINDYQESYDLSFVTNKRNSVDDIIDFVVTSNMSNTQGPSTSLNAEIDMSCAKPKPARKSRAVGSVQKLKVKDGPMEESVGKSVEIVFEKNAAMEVNCKLNIINLDRKNDSAIPKAIPELTPNINIQDRIIESLLGSTFEKETSLDLPISCDYSEVKNDLNLNSGHNSSKDAPKTVKKRGRPKRNGETKCIPKIKEHIQKSTVLETNVDNLLSSEEINTNLGISTSPLSIQNINQNNSSIKLSNEDEPHILENKTVPNQDRVTSSESDEDIPLAAFIKVNKTIDKSDLPEYHNLPNLNDKNTPETASPQGINEINNPQPLLHEDKPHDAANVSNEQDDFGGGTLTNIARKESKNDYLGTEILTLEGLEKTSTEELNEQTVENRTCKEELINLETGNVDVSLESRNITELLDEQPQSLNDEKLLQIPLDDDVLKEQTDNSNNLPDIVPVAHDRGISKLSVISIGQLAENKLNKQNITKRGRRKNKEIEKIENNTNNSEQSEKSEVMSSTSELKETSSLSLDNQNNAATDKKSSPAVILSEISAKKTKFNPNLIENKDNIIKVSKKYNQKSNMFRRSNSATELIRKPKLKYNLSNSLGDLKLKIDIGMKRTRSSSLKKVFGITSDLSAIRKATLELENSLDVDVELIKPKLNCGENKISNFGELAAQDDSIKKEINNIDSTCDMPDIDDDLTSIKKQSHYLESNDKILNNSTKTDIDIDTSIKSPKRDKYPAKFETDNLKKGKINKKIVRKNFRSKMTNREINENISESHSSSTDSVEAIPTDICEENVSKQECDMSSNDLLHPPNSINSSTGLEKITIRINRTDKKSTTDGIETDFSEFCIKNTSTPNEKVQTGAIEKLENKTILATSPTEFEQVSDKKKGGNITKKQKTSKYKNENKFEEDRMKMQLAIDKLENTTVTDCVKMCEENLAGQGDIVDNKSKDIVTESKTLLMTYETDETRTVEKDVLNLYLPNKSETVTILARKGNKRQKKCKAKKTSRELNASNISNAINAHLENEVQVDPAVGSKTLDFISSNEKEDKGSKQKPVNEQSLTIEQSNTFLNPESQTTNLLLQELVSNENSVAVDFKSNFEIDTKFSNRSVRNSIEEATIEQLIKPELNSTVGESTKCDSIETCEEIFVSYTAKEETGNCSVVNSNNAVNNENTHVIDEQPLTTLIEKKQRNCRSKLLLKILENDTDKSDVVASKPQLLKKSRRRNVCTEVVEDVPRSDISMLSDISIQGCKDNEQSTDSNLSFNITLKNNQNSEFEAKIANMVLLETNLLRNGRKPIKNKSMKPQNTCPLKTITDTPNTEISVKVTNEIKDNLKMCKDTACVQINSINIFKDIEKDSIDIEKIPSPSPTINKSKYLRKRNYRKAKCIRKVNKKCKADSTSYFVQSQADMLQYPEGPQKSGILNNIEENDMVGTVQKIIVNNVEKKDMVDTVGKNTDDTKFTINLNSPKMFNSFENLDDTRDSYKLEKTDTLITSGKNKKHPKSKSNKKTDELFENETENFGNQIEFDEVQDKLCTKSKNDGITTEICSVQDSVSKSSKINSKKVERELKVNQVIFEQTSEKCSNLETLDTNEKSSCSTECNTQRVTRTRSLKKQIKHEIVLSEDSNQHVEIVQLPSSPVKGTQELNKFEKSIYNSPRSLRSRMKHADKDMTERAESNIAGSKDPGNGGNPATILFDNLTMGDLHMQQAESAKLSDVVKDYPEQPSSCSREETEECTLGIKVQIYDPKILSTIYNPIVQISKLITDKPDANYGNNIKSIEKLVIKNGKVESDDESQLKIRKFPVRNSKSQITPASEYETSNEIIIPSKKGKHVKDDPVEKSILVQTNDKEIGKVVSEDTLQLKIQKSPVRESKSQIPIASKPNIADRSDGIANEVIKPTKKLKSVNDDPIEESIHVQTDDKEIMKVESDDTSQLKFRNFLIRKSKSQIALPSDSNKSHESDGSTNEIIKSNKKVKSVKDDQKEESLLVQTVDKEIVEVVSDDTSQLKIRKFPVRKSKSQISLVTESNKSNESEANTNGLFKSNKKVKSVKDDPLDEFILVQTGDKKLGKVVSDDTSQLKIRKFPVKNSKSQIALTTESNKSDESEGNTNEIIKSNKNVKSVKDDPIEEYIFVQTDDKETGKVLSDDTSQMKLQKIPARKSNSQIALASESNKSDESERNFNEIIKSDKNVKCVKDYPLEESILVHTDDKEAGKVLSDDTSQMKLQKIPVRKSKSQIALACESNKSDEFEVNFNKIVKSNKKLKRLKDDPIEESILAQADDKEIQKLDVMGKGKSIHSDADKLRITTAEIVEESNITKLRTSRNRPVINYAEDEENFIESTELISKTNPILVDELILFDKFVDIDNVHKKPRTSKNKKSRKKEKAGTFDCNSSVTKLVESSDCNVGNINSINVLTTETTKTGEQISKLDSSRKSTDARIETRNSEFNTVGNLIESPIKIVINKHKTRRKSKSFKKVDNKGPNDLFEDFALVIKKPKGTAPIITFTPADTFSKAADSNDMTNPIDIIPQEISLHQSNIIPANDKYVEEMDMELDEIPITSNIIERSDLNISLPLLNSEEDLIIDVCETTKLTKLTKQSKFKRKLRKCGKKLKLPKQVFSVRNKDIESHEQPENFGDELTIENGDGSSGHENNKVVDINDKNYSSICLSGISLISDKGHIESDCLEGQCKNDNSSKIIEDVVASDNILNNDRKLVTGDKHGTHAISISSEITQKEIDKIYAFSDTEDIEEPLEITNRLQRDKTKYSSEMKDKLVDPAILITDAKDTDTNVDQTSLIQKRKTRSGGAYAEYIVSENKEKNEVANSNTEVLQEDYASTKLKLNNTKEIVKSSIGVENKDSLQSENKLEKKLPTHNITSKDENSEEQIFGNKTNEIEELNNFRILEKSTHFFEQKPIRTAKAKALEHIHDDALADVTINDKGTTHKLIATQDNKNKETAKRNKKSKKTTKAPTILETLDEKSPLLVNLVADLAGLEELENSIERELNGEKDFTHESPELEAIIGKTMMCNEDIMKNTNEDSKYNQELRRSRRPRKITSYSENDVDPVIDNRIANLKKNADKTPYDKKNVSQKKLNSDELFDLLKASTSSLPAIPPKPDISFLSNFEDSLKDNNNIDNFDNILDNILEKSSLLIEDNISSKNELRDMVKVFDFLEEPEISNKENAVEMQAELPLKATVTRGISSENSSTSMISSNASLDMDDKSKARKSGSKNSNYCEICNKSFIRLENLIKHKKTLTHIQKLSEIETKINMEDTNSEAISLTSEFEHIDSKKSEINITSILNSSEKPNNNILPIMHSSFANNHSLKLADIITDVLNKPALDKDNTEIKKIPEHLCQDVPELQSDYKRCKSLGERKSFDSDKIVNCSVIPEPFISKTKILENQICLLENIIENQTTNYIDDISMSSNSSEMQSNSGMSIKPDNIMKPTSNDDSFLKPTQYEEISEDSANLRNYEDQKLRKTLNRDEELFLECCSLLKSGSEVSSYSNKKSQTKNTNNLARESIQDQDWHDEKNSAKTAGFDIIDDYCDDNSRIPTPLGDSYDDGASDSNTISSNWDSNRKDDTNHPNILNTTFNLDEVLNNDKQNNVVEDIKRRYKSPSIMVPPNELEVVSKDHKKIITKGARKVFEGLKVSIPTEDLNMEEVLNSSPKKNDCEAPVSSPKSSLTETQVDILAESVIKPSRSARKSKPVKKSQVGSNLLFKVKKKKIPSTGKNKVNQTEDVIENVNSYDVYDFEETQDYSDIFTKPDFRAFRNLKGNDVIEPESDIESRDYLDPCSVERESITSSVSSLSSVKKSKAEENITKKKCMIMGRIFKNAAKSKLEDIDEEIRSIPNIDNDELLESYVANCKRVIKNEAKPKLTEKEINQLFDQLLENKNAENENNFTTKSTKSKTDSKKAIDVKKKGKLKNRKRTRTNSDSADDEFKLNNSSKRVNRKNAKAEDNCINLEQELKECIGVASRKSQRKCTSGKQNVLVEYWSSDESQFEALLETQRIETIQKNEAPRLPEDKVIVPRLSEDKMEENKEPELPSKEINLANKQNLKQKKTMHKKKLSVDKKEKKTIVEPAKMSDTTSNRRKRAAVNPLYHWSSSSEDELQDLIEVKPIRDEIEDDEDRPIQHGWIVGDSPKKLVTMLAQAKGKKTDIDGVKEQGKKRTNAVS